ncbi:PQQ-binding-like beta-propeller repeat protein [uncultured Imperialibacter sp.]|uniref:outer membrane protein assembly factor BamB family protein n=1 Tax=uncultured Imperialibacter sp. TaxID=1672639 RepID=UPI0030DDCCA0
MKFSHQLLLLLVVCAGVAVTSCKKKKTEVAWVQDFSIIGSQSSPRAADLNLDGVLDIVMGAGKNEYQKSEFGVMALDGKTGELLWRQETTDQVFGSATLYDVNGDQVPDVFIGGRSPHLRALDGKTGEVIWAYNHELYHQDSILQYARFNFYNSVLVPDQNGDGLKDLLIVNGGNSKVEPFSTSNRFPGVLMLMDTKTGEILAADTMPDGKESYMSPIAFQQPGSNDVIILFGTGGETISGSLYATTLADLKGRQLAKAKVLGTENDHGFIAPPSVADITGDGLYDIIAISHASSIFAIDGKTEKPIWTKKIEDSESSNSFAVGYFTDDDVPDFFTFVSRGAWPENTGSVQVMLDGKTGEIAYMAEMGCTGFSSPVVYDLNDDGIDEAIISINEFDCAEGFVNKKSSEILTKLVAINFTDKSVIPIDQLNGFKNIFSTPYIGDMDNDGYLDIVHCQYFNPTSDLMVFLGMKVKRISTGIEMGNPVRWGAYMGSNGDGVFEGK